ncbi:MAG: sigma-E factor negative regulatory protein [Pseudohongiellaceae bacterium]
MQHRERELSALLDAEIDDLELRRLLKSVEKDSELSESWRRYNLAQAVLHDEAVGTVSSGFAARVAAVVDREDLPSRRAGFWKPRWGQAASKLAIAASVAFAFFLGVQSSLNQSADAPQMAQDSDSASGLNSTQVVDSDRFEVDPVARQRLDEYIQSVEIERHDPLMPESPLQDSPLWRVVNDSLRVVRD